MINVGSERLSIMNVSITHNNGPIQEGSRNACQSTLYHTPKSNTETNPIRNRIKVGIKKKCGT